METNKLIDRLRELSKIGIVNYKHDTPVLIEAADRIEELDERIAIMQERMETLEKQAAESEPVRHGHWVKVGGYITPGGDPLWECSECGKGLHLYGVEHGSYGSDVADSQWVACPNCGAVMSEVSE